VVSASIESCLRAFRGCYSRTHVAMHAKDFSPPHCPRGDLPRIPTDEFRRRSAVELPAILCRNWLGKSRFNGITHRLQSP
jgi:hypothetical protein